MRKHSQILRQLVPLQLETNVYGEGAAADLKSKHVEAVKYELEAIMRLQNWDDLDVMFEVGHYDSKTLRLS